MNKLMTRSGLKAALRWFCLVFTPFFISLSCNAVQLRLGFFPNLTHAQALYARASGYFETNGIEVKWQAFNAGPTAIEGLFSGAIDAVFIGPGPTINGYVKSHGEKFVIVAGAASGGAALVVRGNSGIKEAKDFDGKTLATPQLGNSQDIMARMWLQEHGMHTTAQGGLVNLIPLSNPDQLTMFKVRQIDAAWTVEPWVSRLEIEANGKIFLEEKTLWPKGKYVTTYLVVTREFLKEHRDIVKKLIAAHVDITQLLNSNKTAVVKILNEQIRHETSRALRPEVIKRAFDRVEFTWDPIASSLERQAQGAYAIRFLRHKPDLTGIYELGLLNEVLREKKLATVSVERGNATAETPVPPSTK
jgi:NitT/TauT family transport system substrate-binding protein